MRLRGLVAGAIGWLVCIGTAWGQTPFAVPRIQQAPTLDDVAGDRLPAASRVTDFRQREPGDLTPVSQMTTAYVLYDSTNLYVGFHCRADAGQLRARMARREEIADDDHVSLFLDTFHSRQRAYVFAANPLGVQYDAILAEGDDPDDTFDAVWRTDATLTADGYAVLFTVPFRSLRFSRAATQTWGLALGRFSPLRTEDAYWPAITKRVEGFTNQMADAVFAGVAAGRVADVIPYSAATASRYLDETEPAHVTAGEGRVGLDAKIVLRDALSLDLTVNPDFSQVESDEPQVTINRRFEVYFPERRPFFIENSDVFSTPDQLFFSRRVFEPRAGARLTGRVGRWTFGALGAADTSGDSDAEQDAAGVTAIGVVRVQRDLGEQSRVGVLATERRGPTGSNTVISADARLKINPNWVFTGQAARSVTSDTPGGSRSGTDVYGEIARSGRAFNYTASYLDRGASFDPQLGYVDRVDIRQVGQDASYAWHPAGRVLSFGPTFTGWAGWDHQGRRQDWYGEPGMAVSFEGPAELQVSRVEREEVFEGLAFRQHLTKIEGRDAHLKSIVVSGSVALGTAVNYYPPAGRPPELADSVDASVAITWRPLPRFRVDEAYFFTRLRTIANATSSSQRIFDNTIARTTVRYQFTRRLSARVILAYEDVRPTLGLASQTLTRHLTGDALVTYLVDPFTAVYVGYSDRLDNVALTVGPPARLDIVRSLSTSTARQFFVKISYGLRF